MSGQPVLTIVGNLTADPELRFTPSGVAVATFTVAATPRTFDRTADEWRDGDTLFLRVTAWRDLGEHAAASLAKGTRVLVQGRLEQRAYETRDGERRTVVELTAEEIGPSLRHATAQVRRITRRYADPGGTGSATAAAAADRPFPTPAGLGDEPPF